MSKVDQNSEYVALAAVEGTGVATPLLVDPTTGRLLIEINAVVTTVPVLPDPTLDDNHEYVALADNGSGAVPLLIDNRNGYVWCDVFVEP